MNTSFLSRRALLSVFACLALAGTIRADPLPRGEAKAAGFAPEKLERITGTIKEAVDKKQIAGGLALVARHGKVVHLSTVGMQDVEGKVPLTESTIFRIASMSKPITSVAVMILVDDGKLNVTDPLSKFVPEFKDMKVLVPAKDGKTFETVQGRPRNHHSRSAHALSGITYRLLNKPFCRQDVRGRGHLGRPVETPGTVGDNVKKLAKLPLACQPGAAWEYGLNTDVLGHVVEVVSGKSLEEFLRERIFQPLKMNDTCFVLPKEKHSRLCDALFGRARQDDRPRRRQADQRRTRLPSPATYPTQRRQQVLLRRRRPGLDRRRLLPLLPDDAQSRRAGRGPRAQGGDRRTG